MDKANKVILLNRTGTGPGSVPQEPLALVAKISDSERSALESEGRSGLGSVAEPDTTSPEIQYRTFVQNSLSFLFITSRLLEVYYLLYSTNYEMASKIAFDPEEPSLGRIQVNSIAPPHSSASIKRCISRVERNPALLWNADLFVDTSCDTPLKGGHVSILRTDGPGLTPNEPMAIVLRPPISDGKYLIKNRAADIYWYGYYMLSDIKPVHFLTATMDSAKECTYSQVNSHFNYSSVARIILFRSGTSHKVLTVISL